ncbi:type I restriction-modification system, M subunit [Acinetobacter soli CIP 110264]|uniref:type I restriction-modification system subunit M n=1 Tax=Acinetobacter soli TaxID=487316 RepID=UPI0002D0C601|nr:class I SAM-dependent DNA methyltransferase [Acinetobacter soli]ENV58333.1 type I restriction-modification system, M subunit [Acinetobacter soli CIP 110264]
MAIKKSELYSSLWESCDNLRGGMDSSQYKDYILVLLFIKYVSDKKEQLDFIDIPESATFSAMIEFKGNPEIGDLINKQVVAPLAEACALNVKAMPDFNDSTKLGDGQEKVDRLTDLIAIFQRPELDFSNNLASGDDLLGDAFEYLMGHFASESGKSKGQFYTPTEVSRIVASIVGIDEFKARGDTTVYDPTCGSGSLLLRVGAKANRDVSLYGQEKDASTSVLAQMNMFLHGSPTAEIRQGNTLASPKFIENGELQRFDFIVANPPFSDKKWSMGLDISTADADTYGRFEDFGIPPAKQGDYAYLLHIVKSLKSTGKAACILPHGVLFRGNAEADIRQKLVDYGFIKAIIGLPANLFYGTGIPACIIVIDREHAAARKGILMIDASQGFIKDGAKNRLRERDLHKIIDAFKKPEEHDERYVRIVGLDEIIKNGYNLNLPRYIDNSEAEDIQDIEAHLQGGIPNADIEDLADYWKVCPQLKTKLFSSLRDGYVALNCATHEVKSFINQDAEFVAFKEKMQAHFQVWADQAEVKLKALKANEFEPKELITELSESLLAHYKGQDLVDHYSIYQILMDYWEGIMQDDAYIIAADDWEVNAERIIETVKAKKQGGKDQVKDKGWKADLVTKESVINRYFKDRHDELVSEQTKLDELTQELTEHEENHSGDEDILEQGIKEKDVKELWQAEILDVAPKAYAADYRQYEKAQQQEEMAKTELTQLELAHPIVRQMVKDKINTTNKIKAFAEHQAQELVDIIFNYDETLKSLKAAQRTIKTKYEIFDSGISATLSKNEGADLFDNFDNLSVLYRWLDLSNKIKTAKNKVKELFTKLDDDTYKYFFTLTESEIKELVTDDKWLADLAKQINADVERVAQRLTVRVRELAERYEFTLGQLTQSVEELEKQVEAHLVAMGFEL